MLHNDDSKAHFCLLTFFIANYSWDWRACMEDEYMYVDCETGELIHPIHYDAGDQAKA